MLETCSKIVQRIALFICPQTGIITLIERKQVDWLEDRIAQRDTKIDAIYVELRNEQNDKLIWIHKCHELELQLKDAEHNRCDRPDNDCSRRIPPRRVTITKDKEEKK